jgi:hypothetical protein
VVRYSTSAIGCERKARGFNRLVGNCVRLMLQCETAIRFWSRNSIECTNQAIIRITGEDDPAPLLTGEVRSCPSTKFPNTLVLRPAA